MEQAAIRLAVLGSELKQHLRQAGIDYLEGKRQMFDPSTRRQPFWLHQTDRTEQPLSKLVLLHFC